MKYRLFFEDPLLHLIRVEVELFPTSSGVFELFLPKWRPGRYELGSFAENITDVHASTVSGEPLSVFKSAFNSWSVNVSGTDRIFFHYSFFANNASAGDCFFSTDQVSINGVNLLMYHPERIAEPCELELNLPDNYKIACGLRRENQTLFADNFHQLVDGPILASPSLQHFSVPVSGVEHNLWFMGDVHPDANKISEDFRKFGEAQVLLYGGFPVQEYHYLFLIHNKHFYHGVEHYNSTMIALGPGYKLMHPELYEEFLGVSCHELFHTWNVKAIRPVEMQPYFYDGENYSKLHYVTEGVTTYYGDLMLLKSGVWDLENYLRVFNNSVLKRHYQNQGRNHITLEEASYDSWVNGYKAGIANRKISYYSKGALAAFILDHLIREASANARSLDTVMREMYERFGKTGIGYTGDDYKAIAEAHAGINLDDYFAEIIAGKLPLEQRLKAAGNYFGLDLNRRKPTTKTERNLGFRALEQSGAFTVRHLHEGSPAMEAGLAVGDELIALNGVRITKRNLQDVFEYLGSDQAFEFTLFRDERLQKIAMQKTTFRAELYMLNQVADPSEAQLRNRAAWIQIGQTADSES